MTMNDEDLIRYADLHCRTELASFDTETINRLRCLAGLQPRDYGRKPFDSMGQEEWAQLRAMIVKRKSDLEDARAKGSLAAREAILASVREDADLAEKEAVGSSDNGASHRTAKAVVLRLLARALEGRPFGETITHRTLLSLARAMGKTLTDIGEMESRVAIAMENERRSCEAVAEKVIGEILDRSAKAADSDHSDGVMHCMEQAAGAISVRDAILSKKRTAEVSLDLLSEIAAAYGMKIVNAKHLETLEAQIDPKDAARSATLAERRRCVRLIWEEEQRQKIEGRRFWVKLDGPESVPVELSPPSIATRLAELINQPANEDDNTEEGW